MPAVEHARKTGQQGPTSKEIGVNITSWADIATGNVNKYGENLLVDRFHQSMRCRPPRENVGGRRAAMALLMIARFFSFRHSIAGVRGIVTAVGFEPTPLRNGALSHRLRPLGQTVLLAKIRPRLDQN